MIPSGVIAAAFAITLATTGDPRIQTELPGREASGDGSPGSGSGSPSGNGLPGAPRNGANGSGDRDGEPIAERSPLPEDDRDGLAARRARDGSADPPSRSAIPAPSIGGLGQIAFLLLLAALLIAVVAMLYRLRSEGPMPIADPPPPRERAPGSDEAPRAPTSVREADRLADEGRFAEAVHALLLESIAFLARRSTPPDSRTSRELLAHFRLDGSARDDFRAIVLAVERSLFGGRDLERRDYDECRERVERLRRTHAVAA